MVQIPSGRKFDNLTFPFLLRIILDPARHMPVGHEGPECKKPENFNTQEAPKGVAEIPPNL
jgi:hypothetical protein